MSRLLCEWVLVVTLAGSASVWGCGSSEQKRAAGVGGATGDAGTGGTGGKAGAAGASGTGGKAGGAGASGAAGNAGASGAGGKAGSGGCPGTAGPAMAMLPDGFCVDRTEVTRDQYAAWLATSPATTGQEDWCLWNTSFEPTCEWPPGASGNHPVVCVDWCDAYAYCAGVGKRLCGQIGGGPNGFNDIANAGLSQWYRACVSGGAKNVYPYGSSYQDQTCNGADAANAATVPVGSMSGCQPSATGYEGVHDLSGNVSEWGDACSGTAGQQDLCRVRGGSFASASAQLRCDSGLSASRFDALGMIGLRCCGP